MAEHADVTAIRQVVEAHAPAMQAILTA